MTDYNNPLREVYDYYTKLDEGKNLGYNPAWISKDSDGKYHYSMDGPENLVGKIVRIDTTKWERGRMEFWDNIHWEYIGELYEKGLKDEKRNIDYDKTRTISSSRRF
ncbi:MAG: hypothetical protein KKF50_02190 [Nanoarchaeota archaeon]|nr:hypothetical protein [Nanoarchaeota archaeon]